VSEESGPASGHPGEQPAERITPAERATQAERAAEAARERRRARVFGDVLPEATRDDRADGWGDPEQGGRSGEEWLRRQVPPHHG
jgi:hypothetical protein